MFFIIFYNLKFKEMFAKPQQPFIEPNFGENKASKYQKLEKVGNGTYGIVYKAKDNDTNDIVAMKKMILGVFRYYFFL